MSTAFQTEQETFWAGSFGVQYVDRNQGARYISSNAALFSKMFARTDQIDSVLELGANIGINLRAIRTLKPESVLHAVEINPRAAEALREHIVEDGVFETSILQFRPTRHYDLVFTKGVLIHVDPGQLSKVYDLMYETSSRYIAIAEYYNPQPVEVEYRGHQGKLFKRDFAGELMDRFQNLRLVDYGFAYHRDHHFPQDDLNWFVLEKQNIASL